MLTLAVMLRAVLHVEPRVSERVTKTSWFEWQYTTTMAGLLPLGAVVSSTGTTLPTQLARVTFVPHTFDATT